MFTYYTILLLTGLPQSIISVTTGEICDRDTLYMSAKPYVTFPRKVLIIRNENSPILK